MSCPYGDGLFFRRPFCLLRVLVPSLRGRIVPNPPLLEIFILHPVPTGADCSNFIILDFGMGVSRPYWDGLFLFSDEWRRGQAIPSLLGRIIPDGVF